VRDHGPGIPPSDLPHIFDRFYRAPAARGLPGSGLGLAIVAQVADSEGGKVTVAPAPGGGTIFWLGFPPLSPFDHSDTVHPVTKESSHSSFPTKESQDPSKIHGGDKDFAEPTGGHLVVTDYGVRAHNDPS
jgi:hypothetical protein